MFLNDSMQAVVVMACEKHAPSILEKINNGSEGNWFVMPPTSTLRSGYWPRVCDAHAGGGLAIFGFIDREALVHKLREFSASQADNGLCPDCAAYEWNITPLHSALTTHDPVCGRGISCASALSLEHRRRLYFFCSMGCRDRFQRAPENFVSPSEAEPTTLEAAIAG
ncbi:YHS domain-containing protein [bacterium]|nr:MAG: YHS domain-containing protein [bacterium]